MPPEIGWRGGVRDGEADGTREDAGNRAKSRGTRPVRRAPPKKAATPVRAVVRKALSGAMPSVLVASPPRGERDEALEAARERDEQDDDKDEGGQGGD